MQDSPSALTTDFLGWRKIDSWCRAPAEPLGVGARGCRWGGCVPAGQQREACLSGQHISFELAGRPDQRQCQQGKQGWVFPASLRTFICSQRVLAALVTVRTERLEVVWSGKWFPVVALRPDTHAAPERTSAYDRTLGKVEIVSGKNGVGWDVCVLIVIFAFLPFNPVCISYFV